jgi:hypothetical protein
MFFSKPKYFHLSSNYLLANRSEIDHYLKLKRLEPEYYLKAYDYFCEHPKDFDGATIVKDLDDLFGIDLSALRHDYDYIVNLKRYNGLKWLKMKLKYDYKYGRSMELLGKSILVSYLRVVLLWLSTPFYLIITRI